jgi:hypothetical protein
MDSNRCMLLTMRFLDATTSRTTRRFDGAVTPATWRGCMSTSRHEYAIQANELAKLATEAPLTG